MSLNRRKGPIVDPGKCRCCGAVKKCRLLNVEYEWMGQREVYSDMFVDCFGLVLSHMDDEELLHVICATCVMRLRDARAFRQQVLQCEQKLLNANMKIHDDEDVIRKTPVKKENEIEVDEIDIVEEPLRKPDNYNHEIDPMAGTELCHFPEAVVKQEDISPNKNQDLAVKKLSPIRRRRIDGATIDRAKMSMQPKLNKMKKMNTIQHNNKLQHVKSGVGIKNLQNTIKIVEYSYVCPFDSSSKDFYCVYCKYMFEDPDQLREHTMMHDPWTYKNVVNNKSHIQIDIERIDCRLCDKDIDNIETFKWHITSDHRIFIHKDVTNEFMKFKLRKEKRMTCVECNKKSKNFDVLKRHMATHFGTFACNICGARYYNERYLKAHKAIHTNGFKCDECGKTYRLKNFLNYHILRNHLRSEPKLYPCHKCNEVFDSYYNRSKHKLTAHGEPFVTNRKLLRKTILKCMFCDKEFSEPSMKKHITSCHSEAKIKYNDDNSSVVQNDSRSNDTKK